METAERKFIVVANSTEVNRDQIERRTYVWSQDGSNQRWCLLTHGFQNTIGYAAMLNNAEACAVRDTYRKHNFSDPENCFIVPVFPAKK